MAMTALHRKLRKELKAIAEPHKAEKMQSYMKSEMPYLGVQSPNLKIVCRNVIKDLVFTSRQELADAAIAIWREAKFREERYCAIAVTGVRSARPLQSPELLSLYETMIVEGAWWDYVDDLAVHRVGPILLAYPQVMQKRMLAWSKDKNMWKRRTAIISQIGFKDQYDFDHLLRCIEPSLESKEFFLRKAIGWALREVAWRDPQTIIKYVTAHRDILSGLSKREALKNVMKQGLIAKIP